MNQVALAVYSHIMPTLDHHDQRILDQQLAFRAFQQQTVWQRLRWLVRGA